MKKALLIAVVALFGASQAFAVGGSIGVFADPAGLSCNTTDPGNFQVRTLFIVHVLSDGARSSQWSLPLTACLNGWSWVADQPQFAASVCDLGGGSTVGCATPYGGACFGDEPGEMPLHVMNVLLFGSGAANPCCLITVEDDKRDPGLTTPISVNCEGQFGVVEPATGGSVIVNPDPTCECNVPVKDATWGKVKSLYYGE